MAKPRATPPATGGNLLTIKQAEAEADVRRLTNRGLTEYRKRLCGHRPIRAAPGAGGWPGLL
jgi:hypothetical protein